LYFALFVNVFDFKNVKQKTNEVLNMILNLDTVAESPTPMNMILAIYHSVFVEGDQTQMSNTPQWKNTFTSLFEKMNPQACQLVYIIIIINNLSCCNFIRGVFVPFLNPISMLHACNLFTHTPLHFSWYMYSSSHISSYINNKKC
jgi:hypothetical protein